MKKITLLIITIIFSMTAVISNMSEIYTCAAGSYALEEGDFRFVIYDDHCKVVSYSGYDEELIIPDEVNGVPVTECEEDFILYQLTLENMTSITFPKYMTNVTFYFYRAYNLKKINFLGENIYFYGKKTSSAPIEEITLPVSLLDEGTFRGSETLKKAVLTGTGDLTISKEAFKNCTSLKEVVFIGYDNINIGREAFSGCTSLDTIIFPENCEQLNIGVSGFENTALTNISFDGQCELDKFAFKNCTKLSNVTFDKNANISSYAFKDCVSLSEININYDISFGNYAFFDCENLKNININDPEKIKGNAFCGCKNLTTINNIPVFDDKLGDFTPQYKDLVLEKFYNSDDVGFINQFILSESEKIVSENITDDMSDVQKVKVLHDWVCDNTEYNYDDNHEIENHNDLSVFIGRKTVCEGYARACNILFNAAGIESSCVISADHAWNIVNIDDKYFHVDATWDDTSANKYEWFMRSDAELKAAGGSHANWSINKPSSLHDFQDDILHECSYSMGDVNVDGEVNIADVVKLSKYLLLADNLTGNNCILSDLTFDDQIDAFDLALLRKKIIDKS